MNRKQFLGSLFTLPLAAKILATRALAAHEEKKPITLTPHAWTGTGIVSPWDRNATVAMRAAGPLLPGEVVTLTDEGWVRAADVRDPAFGVVTSTAETYSVSGIERDALVQVFR